MFVVHLDRRHHLALGGERDLAHASETALAPLRSPKLALGHQERGFGRVALDLPHARRALAQIGVAGEAAAGEDHDVFGKQRTVLERTAFVLCAPFGRIADAGDAGRP